MSRMSITILSDSEIEKLHEKTLHVFETVGIKIIHDEMLQQMKKAGAKVNESAGICKFPAAMVEATVL